MPYERTWVARPPVAPRVNTRAGIVLQANRARVNNGLPCCRSCQVQTRLEQQVRVAEQMPTLPLLLAEHCR